MSVSVDTDRQAWVDMVVNDQLGGVQLWADGWSQITKDYAIFGIPRFMLFDQDGKVISTDALTFKCGNQTAHRRVYLGYTKLSFRF